jgi:hypothetical protein
VWPRRSEPSSDRWKLLTQGAHSTEWSPQWRNRRARSSVLSTRGRRQSTWVRPPAPEMNVSPGPIVREQRVHAHARCSISKDSTSKKHNTPTARKNHCTPIGNYLIAGISLLSGSLPGVPAGTLRGDPRMAPRQIQVRPTWCRVVEMTAFRPGSLLAPSPGGPPSLSKDVGCSTRRIAKASSS